MFQRRVSFTVNNEVNETQARENRTEDTAQIQANNNNNNNQETINTNNNNHNGWFSNCIIN